MSGLRGRRSGPALGASALAVAAAAAGFLLVAFGGPAVFEAWFLAFVILAGLSAGSLGLLMIGHLMSEDWLAPVRRDAEALCLAFPLLVVLAVPLAFRLDALYPWAGGDLSLPEGLAIYLRPAFFLLRSALYLAVWTGLAMWIARTRHVRRTSAIGLALLAPTIACAANDWVLSREPQWWSSLFGFAFGLSQVLAALAVVLTLVLSRRGPDTKRMISLERALLTLALLSLWTWFSQFLIVWLANLPDEAAWYLARLGEWRWVMVWVVLPTALAAIVILVPTGVGRWSMMAGAGLLVVHHLAHMIWLIRPGGKDAVALWLDAAMLAGLGAIFALWVSAARRFRPRPDR